MTWYLVKTNWPTTEAALAGYAGLGGDVWPLDGAPGDAGAIHAEVMSAREAVPLVHSTEMLCKSEDLAIIYLETCAENMAGASPVLLEVGSPREPGPWDGYDVGHAWGGYSLTETEVLLGGRTAALNRLGLFATLDDVVSYLANRREGGLEEADQLETCAVRLITPGSAGREMQP